MDLMTYSCLLVLGRIVDEKLILDNAMIDVQGPGQNVPRSSFAFCSKL